MTGNKARSTARDGILDAALALVHEVGAAHLTLDAVARRATVSKGGLLYHFPSKEALLEGMVARQLARFEQDQLACLEGDPEDPQARLVAFIRASLNESEEERRLGASVLAAVANQPELLDPAREANRRQTRLFARGPLGPERTGVLWLATLGLWLIEALQVSPFSPAARRRIAARILDMARTGF